MENTHTENNGFGKTFRIEMDRKECISMYLSFLGLFVHWVWKIINVDLQRIEISLEVANNLAICWAISMCFKRSSLWGVGIAFIWMNTDSDLDDAFLKETQWKITDFRRTKIKDLERVYTENMCSLIIQFSLMLIVNISTFRVTLSEERLQPLGNV